LRRPCPGLLLSTPLERHTSSELMPKAAILTIGTELLLGKVVDTNGAYLGERLSDAGFDVTLSMSLGDHLEEITRWIQLLFQEVELIVTTGGLGPTQDDLTRQAVADALNVPLRFNEFLLREIEEIFKSRGFRMTENNRRQAYLPEGAVPVSNPVGTAPAFYFRTEKDRVIACLPGVPRELKYLLEKRMLPSLREMFKLSGTIKRTRILKVCGLGESGVDQQIGDLMKTEGNPFVGVLASPGMIRILITAEGKEAAEVHDRIAGVEREIRRRLGTLIFGADDETLEGVALSRLSDVGRELVIRDTATGGEVARKLLRCHTGKYFSQSCLGFNGDSSEVSCTGETPGTICLSLRPLEREGNAELQTFLITIQDHGTSNETRIRLGGPRSDVETRLAVIAIDQLRKWGEETAR